MLVHFLDVLRTHAFLPSRTTARRPNDIVEALLDDFLLKLFPDDFLAVLTVLVDLL